MSHTRWRRALLASAAALSLGVQEKLKNSAALPERNIALPEH
jgi:hypothetical protein